MRKITHRCFNPKMEPMTSKRQSVHGILLTHICGISSLALVVMIYSLTRSSSYRTSSWAKHKSPREVLQPGGHTRIDTDEEGKYRENIGRNAVNKMLDNISLWSTTSGPGNIFTLQMMANITKMRTKSFKENTDVVYQTTPPFLDSGIIAHDTTSKEENASLQEDGLNDWLINKTDVWNLLADENQTISNDTELEDFSGHISSSNTTQSSVDIINSDQNQSELLYEGNLNQSEEYDPFHQLFATRYYTSLLNATPPEYLNNYRNPCWKDPIGNPDEVYREHFWWNFMMVKKMQYATTKLPKLLDQRLQQGIAWKPRCLPYFYVAGVTKCGTSDLFEKISRHPMIAYPAKEIHWWSRLRTGDTDNYRGFYVPIKQYVDLMDLPSLDVERYTVPSPQYSEGYHPIILGEGSPSYFWFNERWLALQENARDGIGPKYHVAHYIHHVTPEARIIVIVRDPVARAYSHYRFSGGRNPKEFHNLVVKSVRIMTNCLEQHTPWRCVNIPPKRPCSRLNIGMYSVYLRKWLEVFPREQIFILRLEDYAKERMAYLNDIYAFLGLDPLPIGQLLYLDSSGIRNQNQKVKPMLTETRNILKKFYRPYNADLADLLRDPKYMWN